MTDSEQRRALIVLDLSCVATSEELQLLLRDSLGFPGWYGLNWNAFWDGITALVEMPQRLHFVGWSAFAERLPWDADMMRKCFEEVSVKYPSLASSIEY